MKISIHYKLVIGFTIHTDMHVSMAQSFVSQSLDPLFYCFICSIKLPSDLTFLLATVATVARSMSLTSLKPLTWCFNIAKFIHFFEKTSFYLCTFFIFFMSVSFRWRRCLLICFNVSIWKYSSISSFSGCCSCSTGHK